jgi:fructokinase
MVVTYGEALVDMIEIPNRRFQAVLGGSVCNFTLAAARQGLPVTYLNPLSHDSFGDGFAALLDGAGVALATPRRSACPTSLAIVTLGPDGTPSYAFHRQGVADRDITPRQAAAALPQRPALFHTGGLTLLPDDLEHTLAVAQAAAAGGALLSVDANMRPLAAPDLAVYAAGVRRALAQADLIKVSEEDLQYLGYGIGNGSAAPRDIARTLLTTLNPSLVALTLGAEGAVLLTRQACVTVRPPPGIAVRDTVGCGDCFMAGLVAWLHGAGMLARTALAYADAPALEQAARYAVATASLNAMRDGCQPPQAAEVDAWLRQSAPAMPPPSHEHSIY